MTTRDIDDAGSDELACLTALTPRALRADAVHLRCRSELVRRATRAQRRRELAGSLARLCVPALLGAVPVLYAVELFITMFRVEAWLRAY